MSYALLEKQIKSLPPKYYTQVENFVQFVIHEAQKEQRKKRPGCIKEKMNEVYTKVADEEQLVNSSVTLESFRELTKNDTW